jgi:hypothetical protein
MFPLFKFIYYLDSLVNTHCTKSLHSRQLPRNTTSAKVTLEHKISQNYQKRDFLGLNHLLKLALFRRTFISAFFLQALKGWNSIHQKEILLHDSSTFAYIWQCSTLLDLIWDASTRNLFPKDSKVAENPDTSGLNINQWFSTELKGLGKMPSE